MDLEVNQYPVPGGDPRGEQTTVKQYMVLGIKEYARHSATVKQYEGLEVN